MLPPPQGVELRAVDTIVLIVEGPVGDPDQAVVEIVLGAIAEQLEHTYRNLDVGHAKGRLDVVRFAHDAFVQQCVESVCRVGCIQVAPNVQAGALDCERLLVRQESAEARDNF